jgi:hypothetical protein
MCHFFLGVLLTKYLLYRKYEKRTTIRLSSDLDGTASIKSRSGSVVSQSNSPSGSVVSQSNSPSGSVMSESNSSDSGNEPSEKMLQTLSYMEKNVYQISVLRCGAQCRLIRKLEKLETVLIFEKFQCEDVDTRLYLITEDMVYQFSDVQCDAWLRQWSNFLIKNGY